MKKKELFLSVIIPVYNSALTLNKCIESVINQNFGNYEIIIVDDGSTDKTDSLKANNEVRKKYLEFLDYAKSCYKKDLSYRTKAAQKYVMKKCGVPIIRINTNKEINKVRNKILKKLKFFIIVLYKTMEKK